MIGVDAPRATGDEADDGRVLRRLADPAMSPARRAALGLPVVDRSCPVEILALTYNRATCNMPRPMGLFRCRSPTILRQLIPCNAADRIQVEPFNAVVHRHFCFSAILLRSGFSQVFRVGRHQPAAACAMTRDGAGKDKRRSRVRRRNDQHFVGEVEVVFGLWAVAACRGDRRWPKAGRSRRT